MFMNKLDDIMDQRYTRQEFLKIGGSFVLAVIGLPTLMKALQHSLSGKNNESSGRSGHPYGR